MPFAAQRVLPHPEVAEIYLRFLTRRRVIPSYGDARLIPHIGQKTTEIAVKAGQGYRNPILIAQPLPYRLGRSCGQGFPDFVLIGKKLDEYL
jgi:hypothetical protein